VQHTAKAAVVVRKAQITVRGKGKPAAKASSAKVKPKATKVSAQSFAQATQVERQRQAAVASTGIPSSIANKAALSGCTGGFAEEGGIVFLKGVGIMARLGRLTLSGFKATPQGFAASCLIGAGISVLSRESPTTGRGLQVVDYTYDGYDIFNALRKATP